jgi:glycogen synthase
MARSIAAMMDKIKSQALNNDKKNVIINVLHAAVGCGKPGTEKTPAVGGIDSVVDSLWNAQQAQKDELDARVIIPYYEALNDPSTAFEEVCQVEHIYKGRTVKSAILKKITADSAVQYVVKPLDPEGASLFNAVIYPEMIYSDGWNGSTFIERISYFSGAVSAFSCAGEPSFKPDVVQGHGWALAFLGKLIRKKREENNNPLPYTVYLAHSVHEGDGVYPKDKVPYIGLSQNDTISLTQEILKDGFDHIVYVSDEHLKGSIDLNYVLDAYRNSKASTILNNIDTSKFDPSRCLPDGLKFDSKNISAGKQKLKDYLNNTLLKVMNKQISLDGFLITYVGRYSEEKGIEKLDEAIRIALQNGGSFIGKYKDNKNVIFLTTHLQQQEYGNIVRCASDFGIVPSKLETCGLVPMEFGAAGTIVVASRIGGLINVVIPHVNGWLFEYAINFEEVLQNAIDEHAEMKRTGKLDAVLKLIQESSISRFDWNSKPDGSAFAYLDLYRRLGNQAELKKKLREKETILTEALLNNNEFAIKLALDQGSPNLLAPNKLGMTPEELALKIGRPDLYERIKEMIEKTDFENISAEPKTITESLSYDGKKRIIIHACFEFDQVQYGGVGHVVTSLTKWIHADNNRFSECRIIMPHYPWHDDLIQEKLVDKKAEYKIKHMYDNEMIESTITKINNNGVIQYLVKPSSPAIYQKLYADIQKNEQNKIFDNMTPKMAYFNSAVAAFLAQERERADIVLMHGWGCALIPSLLKNRENIDKIKTIQIVHSDPREQGVVSDVSSHFKHVHGIGLDFGKVWYVSPLKEGIQHADKTVYVSEYLLKQFLEYDDREEYFQFDSLIQKHHEEGKLTAIFNGIGDDFHPSKLMTNKDEWSKSGKISENKYIAKCKLANDIETLLSSGTASEKAKETFSGKKLDCEKNWTLFVGRFSEEKGIDRLEYAIDSTLEENGIFIIMGLYGGGKEDLTIRLLAEKYKDNPNVIIMHEQNYDLQKKYGHPIRYACDITFSPSFREGAGIAPRQQIQNGNFIISSDVGGLNDTVIHYETGIKYKEHSPDTIASLKQAIKDGNQFINHLKSQDNDAYELFLQNLYQISMEKYLYNGQDGCLRHYFELFDSLSPYELNPAILPQKKNFDNSYKMPENPLSCAQEENSIKFSPLPQMEIC